MAGIIFNETSGLNDSIFGKSQAPIKAMVKESVESFEAMSLVDKIFYMDTSTNFAEKYTSETSLGNFQATGENGAHPKASMQEGYSKTITPITWKNSFEVSAEMIEDAKFGKIKSRANIFATSYNRTREEYAAALLAGGVGSSVKFGGVDHSTLGADGVSLFSKVHPSITGGTAKQSNIFSAAFSQDTLDRVQEEMQKFKDDDGHLLNSCPDTIIIPNIGALKRAVFAAVGSELDSTSGNNAINFQLGLWNVLVWNYLPATIGGKPYFIMADSKFNQDYMAAPWVDRVKLTVTSDIDRNTDANVWYGRARFGAGFNNWRGFAISGEGLTGTALS